MTPPGLFDPKISNIQETIKAGVLCSQAHDLQHMNHPPTQVLIILKGDERNTYQLIYYTFVAW